MKFEWRTAGSIAACLLLVAPLSAQQSAQLDKPVRLKADGEFIDTGKDIGYAGPLFVDYDRDGKPDLLVSAFRGNIRFFKNVGTRSAPKFEEREPLQAGGDPIRVHNW